MDTAHRAKLKAKAREELTALGFITAYFSVFLGAFNTYGRLILHQQGISYLHYGIAVVEALILGKIILIGDALNVGRRMEQRSLIQSVFFKSVVFALLVYVFTLGERIVEGLIERRDWQGIVQKMFAPGLDETLSRTIMMFVAFVPFFALWEMRRVLGPQRFADLWLSTGQSTADGSSAPDEPRR